MKVHSFTCTFDTPINIPNHVVTYGGDFEEEFIVQLYYDFNFQPKEVAFYNKNAEEVKKSADDIIAIWRIKTTH